MPSLHGTGVRRYILVVHHVLVGLGVSLLPRAAARCECVFHSRRNPLSRISIVLRHRLAAPLWHQCVLSFIGNLIREPGRAPNISILPEERGPRCPRSIGQQDLGGGPTALGFLGMCLPVLQGFDYSDAYTFPTSDWVRQTRACVTRLGCHADDNPESNDPQLVRVVLELAFVGWTVASRMLSRPTNDGY